MTNNNVNEIKSSLSVILIMGWVLKKLPIKVTQLFLNYAIQLMYKKHPKIFKKLSDDKLNFEIEATDLPFSFYLNPAEPSLTAYYKNEAPNASAKIKGKLIDLLMLFEGEKDGDAMFFSKELIIEGSTAAAVNLRNTLDGEEMHIMEDLSGDNIVLKKIIKFAFQNTVKTHNQLQSFIDCMVQSINYNSNEKNSATENKLNKALEEIDNFKQFVYEYKKQQIRKKSDYTEKDQ